VATRHSPILLASRAAIPVLLQPPALPLAGCLHNRTTLPAASQRDSWASYWERVAAHNINILHLKGTVADIHRKATRSTVLLKAMGGTLHKDTAATLLRSKPMHSRRSGVDWALVVPLRWVSVVVCWVVCYWKMLSTMVNKTRTTKDMTKDTIKEILVVISAVVTFRHTRQVVVLCVLAFSILASSVRPSLWMFLE